MIYLFLSLLFMLSNGFLIAMQESVRVQTVQLKLLAHRKVTLSYPLFYDWVRDNIIAPSCQESETNIGVFDEQGNEVAQLVGNDALVWDVKGIKDNPYMLVSTSCSVDGKHCKVISWNLATRKDIITYYPQDETMLMRVLGYKNRSDQYVIAAAGGGDNEPLLYLINAESGELIKKCTGNHTTAIYSIIKAVDQNWFATMQTGGQRICVWDFEGNNSATITVNDEKIHKQNPVQEIIQHKDLGAFIISSVDKTDSSQLSFWSQQSNFSLFCQFLWQDVITALKVSHDNKYIASGGYCGHLSLWQVNNVKDCKEIAQCVGHQSKVNDIQFKFPQKLLISVSGNDRENISDISVRIWNFDGTQLACVTPNNLKNELEYIQLTKQNEMAIASSAGDIFFYKLIVQPKIENRTDEDSQKNT